MKTRIHITQILARIHAPEQYLIDVQMHANALMHAHTCKYIYTRTPCTRNHRRTLLYILTCSHRQTSAHARIHIYKHTLSHTRARTLTASPSLTALIASRDIIIIIQFVIMSSTATCFPLISSKILFYNWPVIGAQFAFVIAVVYSPRS